VQKVEPKESLRVDRHQRDAIREDSMKRATDATGPFYKTLSMFGTDFERNSFRAVLGARSRTSTTEEPEEDN
jgi:hypothetical protein